MRLSTVGGSALRFTLAFAVILLFSSHTFAQHSGGGTSSAGSSGGGGSHGGSSGGSASSGGGHSSAGGSSAHTSSGHTSAGHSSAGHSSSGGTGSSHAGPSHSNTAHPTAHSNTAHPTHNPSTGVRGTAQTPHKHGFFSFLRHHVPKPEPKPVEPKPEPKQPVAELRRPICFRGPCPVCPAGQFHGANGCGGNILQNRIERRCPAGEHWGIGGCVQQTWYQDECGGLRVMMERQAQRMQEAERDRKISCSLGPWQQCSDSTNSAESEAGFYRELQGRYQACQRRSPTALSYRGFRIPGYSAGLSFDSLSLGLGRR